MRIERLLLSLTFMFLTTFAHAQDWPQFRGPSGQGLFTDGRLPTEWSDTKNVAWKQPIAGLGWSSPVLVGGRIYLTTSVPGADAKKDLSLRALCLNSKTGEQLWEKEIFQPDGKVPKIHGKNSHASPTPLIDGDRIYVHFGHLGTACLDLTGKIIWKKTITYSPVHGSGGSPVLTDSAVVFSCDGGNSQFVIALDRATGNELWKTPRKSSSPGNKFAFSTPLLITVAGQTQIVSPGAGCVCAYEPKTGKEIWRATYGDGYSVIPRPVFAHGLLFVSSSYNSPVLHAIRPDGQGDVTATHIAWKLSKGAPHTPSTLAVGDELYVVSDSGLASCLDAKTGKVHWQERVEGGYSASPMYADGKVYFQNEAGLGTVVKAGKEFEKLATNSLGEKTLASYAAADGALFIRTQKHLYRIQAK